MHRLAIYTVGVIVALILVITLIGTFSPRTIPVTENVSGSEETVELLEEAETIRTEEHLLALGTWTVYADGAEVGTIKVHTLSFFRTYTFRNLDGDVISTYDEKMGVQAKRAELFDHEGQDMGKLHHPLALTIYKLDIENPGDAPVGSIEYDFGLLSYNATVKDTEWNDAWDVKVDVIRATPATTLTRQNDSVSAVQALWAGFHYENWVQEMASSSNSNNNSNM